MSFGRGGRAPLTGVLHLINSFRVGGSESQAVQLVRLLRERGVGVTVACLDPAGPLREELGPDPPDVLEYPLTSFHDLNAAIQLRRFVAELRTRDVGIVHSHDVYSNIFGLPAARLAGVGVRIGSRRDTGGVGGGARRRLERALFAFAHKVVTNAHAVARDLIMQGVPESKVVTIPNAVDFERVRPKLDRPEALDLFRLPSDRRFVVLVANMSHAVKDHPTFLRAAERVLTAVPTSAFVVAGSGPLAAELRAFARHLGIGNDTFFIGACARIGDLLSVADVCVLCSKAEGLSNAVLEYMAAGRPVVATDAGGLREAIVEGETGYLVPVGDDVALADRVVSLLDDPAAARAMGERGRRRAQERFSCDMRVTRTMRLYEQLLERGGGI